MPANLAEGHARGTREDYAHFVTIARGSLAETETFLLLTVNVSLLTVEQTKQAIELCAEISKMSTA